jgi:hypothetical protein
MDLPEDDLLVRAMQRRAPAGRSAWRRCISSKIATARSAGAAVSIGTTSASKNSASGSGRRRPRTCCRDDGSRWSCSKRYAVGVLIAAFAALTAGPSVCRKVM